MLAFKCPICGGSAFSSRMSRLMHGPLGGDDSPIEEMIGKCHANENGDNNGDEVCFFGWSRKRDDHKYFVEVNSK